MGKTKGQQPETSPMLEKLRAMAKQVRTGGKGSVRRKNKVIHHSAGDDEKKVSQFIQQNNCHQLPSVQVIDIMKNDANFLEFNKPKGTKPSVI